MPPIVAWSTVEVSGPNSRPKAAAARFSDAWITPGSTRARRASGSMVQDAVELEAVDGDARPHRLTRDAGGGAAGDQRHAVLGGDRRRGVQVGDRRRDEHHVGDDAVDRGVGRVQPALERRRGDGTGGRAPQRFAGGAPLRRELGDAVAGAHGAKDTASEPARAESRQPAAHLLEQAEHHEHPEDDEQHPGPDLDGAVVPLHETEA